jgi:bifunctional NMN adenylyltransferase/nudix hydrolase
MKSFDYCVCIGRFQPFHLAHYELVKEALSLAETVLIVIGSAEKAPNIENPWSAEQREEIIRRSLSEEELKRVKFLGVRDFFYQNNRWLAEVQSIVYEATDGVDDSRICDIGERSFFPQWKFFKMRNLDRMPHATTVRGLYFTHDAAYKNNVKPAAVEYLEEFKTTQTFKDLKDEYDFTKNYRNAWSGAPFVPIFHTVDAVVIKSGHVLVVRRKGNPGRGQIALPGGFLNQKETLVEGCLRELKEETGIKISKEELEKTITDSRPFDYPLRSLRGRTITQAYLFDLGSGPLPIVKGADDADKAWWMSLSDFSTRECEFFEDHFHIISHFVNKF